MYKLLIADDEPKIRRGLGKLQWNNIGVEVIGEAIDGSDALNKVSTLLPDIMLVDINMPIINGLELIEKVQKIHPDCLVIIVSGYDEFEYAREALKYNVFDYILKPVNRQELFKTVEKGIKKLESEKKQDDLVQWATTQVVSDQDIMVKNFFKKWIAGGLNDYEVNQNLQILNISLRDFQHVLLLQILPIIENNKKIIEGELLEFCVLNILNEIFEDSNNRLCVKTETDVYLVFYGEIGPESKLMIMDHLSENIKQYLSLQVNLLDVNETLKTDNFCEFYQHHLEELKKQGELSPLVMLAKNYIESHYSNSSLSIEDVAKVTRVSTSYLTKSLKKELGLSYTELVLKVRIENGIKLMADPMLRLYDISEKTGFSTQHYFSAAFKKEVGVSPAMFRKERFHHE